MDEVLTFYGIAAEGFRRDAEAEVVHLRKGAVDEWRGVFSEAQAARAWRQIPSRMAERFAWRR